MAVNISISKGVRPGDIVRHSIFPDLTGRVVVISNGCAVVLRDNGRVNRYPTSDLDVVLKSSPWRDEREGFRRWAYWSIR